MVKEDQESRRSGDEPAGIIDTIGQAFALLNRRPYLIWLPILIDLAVWSGWRVTVIEPFAAHATFLGRYMPDVSETIAEGLETIDVVGILTFVMPTLVDGTGPDQVPALIGTSQTDVHGIAGLLILLSFSLLTVLIGVMYLVVIGRVVNNRPAWGTRFLADIAATCGRSIALGATITGIVAFLFFPFVLVALLLQFAGVEPWVLLALIGLGFATWFGLVFFFGLQALALGEPRVLGAVRTSYQLLIANLLPICGLLLIAIVIRSGTPFALQAFTETRWSVPFAIVVNAYIATGLVASLMLFFRNRWPGFRAEPGANHSLSHS